ncbi:hypothetical protein O181_091439 [Austropuccinia psidii MF-1]|uniref:Uncharacterized protein n=1 Tax=Austropuccinia psidii MF-1 TaxID=1389203 RepID=A0A9Q3IXK9_9BASI|nr:hypothetical protein [Austropuccinia psidii MF-1]
MKKGRVWMNLKNLNNTGYLHSYINNTQRFLLELQSVSVKLPPQIFSYIILEKLGKNSSLAQVLERLILNDNLLAKPDKLLLRLQEYTNIQATQIITKDSTPVSDLILLSEHQFKITHFCYNGIHNPKCTTHTKEYFGAKIPHLQPP